MLQSYNNCDTIQASVSVNIQQLIDASSNNGIHWMVALENYTNLFTTPVLNKLGHLLRAITLRIVNSTPSHPRRQHHNPYQALSHSRRIPSHSRLVLI